MANIPIAASESDLEVFRGCQVLINKDKKGLFRAENQLLKDHQRMQNSFWDRELFAQLGHCMMLPLTPTNFLGGPTDMIYEEYVPLQPFHRYAGSALNLRNLENYRCKQY